MTEKQIVPGVYRHSASKKEYTLVCEGKSSETLEKQVVYRSNYDGKIWIRPRYMWDEIVELEDGSKVSRFVRLQQSWWRKIINWFQGY